MHDVLRRLRDITEAKKTRLCVSADMTTTDDLVDLIHAVGDSIAILKTHVDMLEDFSYSFTKELTKLAKEKDFLIFEDRKFADIGNTVKEQFAGGLYRIADWADIVTVHSIVGPGILTGLSAVNKKTAFLLLAQMTPKGNLFTRDYALKTAEMAESSEDVIGCIGSADSPDTLRSLRSALDAHKVIMTPGVQVGSTGDSMGQTYVTPERARTLGADILIVGRGITSAEDRTAAAEMYRIASWK